ncbi:unnamed protein product [Oncorhynchus mykiss]|uniref:Integrase zinc-binding domain-containing protein n=1 Tax=Oncorhynchus mykiss TaxID=8022 RepID=A0A060X9Q1_ONCMY|nr:unnamed protein product [Oncorhynchus mykiss]
MPSSCIVAALSWEIEPRALLNQPDPRNGPCKALFVPDSVLRSDVLQWGHSTHLTCHPGMNRTVAFLRQRFCGPPCRKTLGNSSQPARSVLRTKPTSGLLRPLPIPSRPWSHIALDFVPGLPPSNGNSVILTIIIDRFSKAHFIPLQASVLPGDCRPAGIPCLVAAWHP